MDTLVGDARALMSAGADVAGERVSEDRKRLESSLESGRGLYGSTEDGAVVGAKATSEFVHDPPYEAIGNALGVGANLGSLVARRRNRNRG